MGRGVVGGCQLKGYLSSQQRHKWTETFVKKKKKNHIVEFLIIGVKLILGQLNLENFKL